ncbi:thermonuclease family protein [Aquimarina macrocephali]|uniref:thermonuclease family protein n=1 Tax=Aquimarina macrocephali TaxID=666563 RepID=UPI0004B89FCF
MLLPVTVTTNKQNKDQYVRYIAEVIYSETNISDYLIDKNVAIAHKRKKTLTRTVS